MTNRTLVMTDAVYDYLLKQGIREPSILAELRQETAQLPGHAMQIAPEQGQFMAMLATLTGVRRYLEVGTFTGYSALAIALALPKDSYLLTCDIDERATAVAKRYWEKAGVADKITLALAPAVTTLTELLANGEANTFDMAFIDADKSNYLAYYELLLQLVRPGGVILIDNVLWYGRVADTSAQEKTTLALRYFNEQLQTDSRIELCMLPLGDGLTMARKL